MKKGFTLLELLLVIVILGVLAALISGNFVNSLKKGRDARRKGDLDQISKALEMYYEDKRAYPTTIKFNDKLCETSDCNSGEKVYMQRVPNDPITSRTYEYRTDASGTYYQLYACLENTSQRLPYVSTGSTLYCPTTCEKPDGTSTSCIWGISSYNTTP